MGVRRNAQKDVKNIMTGRKEPVTKFRNIAVNLKKTLMTDKEIEKATAIFKTKLTAWHSNKEKEINAYEYEKTYVETMQSIEKEVLQIMSGTKKKSRNSKKKSRPV